MCIHHTFYLPFHMLPAIFPITLISPPIAYAALTLKSDMACPLIPCTIYALSSLALFMPSHDCTTDYTLYPHFMHYLPACLPGARKAPSCHALPARLPTAPLASIYSTDQLQVIRLTRCRREWNSLIWRSCTCITRSTRKRTRTCKSPVGRAHALARLQIAFSPIPFYLYLTHAHVHVLIKRA